MLVELNEQHRDSSIIVEYAKKYDINTPLDFEFAKLLIKDNSLI